MKKHLKQPIPLAYQRWFDENNERFQTSSLDEQAIFDKITPKLKKTLNKYLLAEQGHICAYCGKRVGILSETKEKLTFSIDHFEPKFCNRSLTLVYENLVGTCKMSEYKSIVILLTDVKATPKTYQNIANEKHIDLEDFTGKGRMQNDDDLAAHGITYVKYRDIPLHCDDKKEAALKKMGWNPDTLSESVTNHILHPNQVDCEGYFEYDQDGSIKPNLKLPASEVRKAENTINVFNLDNSYLRKARADAYKRVSKLLEFDISKETTIDDIYKRDKDGKLDPYCFVAAHVFKKYIE